MTYKDSQGKLVEYQRRELNHAGAVDMNSLSLEIGQRYLIDHDRKGKFYGILKFFDDTWMIFDTENADDEIVVRKSFCRMTLVE